MLSDCLNFPYLGASTNLDSVSSLMTTAFKSIGRRCLFLWCRLLREQKTTGRHAALNYAARANSWEFIDFLFAFIFAFRFYADEPATCFWHPRQTVECRNTPIGCSVIILYTIVKKNDKIKQINKWGRNIKYRINSKTAASIRSFLTSL